VRSLAFFLSRASRSENRQRRRENVVVALLSPAVSHDGSLRLPDLLHVARSRRIPERNTVRGEDSPMLRHSTSSRYPANSFAKPRGACFNICTKMFARGGAYTPVPTTCFPGSDGATRSCYGRLPGIPVALYAMTPMHMSGAAHCPVSVEKTVAVFRRANNLHLISF